MNCEEAQKIYDKDLKLCNACSLGDVTALRAVCILEAYKTWFNNNFTKEKCIKHILSNRYNLSSSGAVPHIELAFKIHRPEDYNWFKNILTLL